MREKSVLVRKSLDRAVKLGSAFAGVIGIALLLWILSEVVQRGVSSLDLGFFTHLPEPPGVEGGGLANALLGTFLITLVATLIGVPIGLLTGVYLSEYGREDGFARWVRAGINMMMGIPSILVGLFVFVLLVVPFRHFSGYAGAVSLAILMIPIVARTTEDMLGMIPSSLREAALALGAPRVKVTFGILFRAARSGLLTGVLLAVARVSGETAPLLFTALNSPFWPKTLGEPTANLTVTIFNYAMSPYDNWQKMAWGASFVIMAAILALTITARVLFQEEKRK